MSRKLTPQQWSEIREGMLARLLSENDRKPDAWIWCLHCNRCYRNHNAAWSAREKIFRCAYYGCNGSLLVDGWDWQQIAQANGYPNEPELNTVYPQFGGTPKYVKPERGFGSDEMIAHIIDNR